MSWLRAMGYDLCMTSVTLSWRWSPHRQRLPKRHQSPEFWSCHSQTHRRLLWLMAKVRGWIQIWSLSPPDTMAFLCPKHYTTDSHGENGQSSRTSQNNLRDLWGNSIKQKGECWAPTTRRPTTVSDHVMVSTMLIFNARVYLNNYRY